jgi:hypothetical protein
VDGRARGRAYTVKNMKTEWLEPRRTDAICARHEAFWRGELDQGPLLWIYVPQALPGTPPAEPPDGDSLWTDVDYVIAKAKFDLGHTHYAGDALPVFNPWLGPDQFAAWLGAEMVLRPRENTSWTKPFVADWAEHADLQVDRANRWWRLYWQIVDASVAAGKDKWITAYPDLHTGIDGLCALRGPDNLMVDMLERPESVHRAMDQMTRLWKEVVDELSARVLPAGQGTSNWTMGWSRERFVCIGQNDFTCLIGPKTFDEFCLRDTVECINHVDHSLYHLDGPGALKHLPRLLEIERLDCIQWIQGATQPLPSEWLGVLQQIQAAGKSVQLLYAGTHGGQADFQREIDILCKALDPRRLFLVIEARSVEEAEFLVRYARDAAR